MLSWEKPNVGNQQDMSIGRQLSSRERPGSPQNAASQIAGSKGHVKLANLIREAAREEVNAVGGASRIRFVSFT